MKEKIINQLKELENSNDIEILYACESGSRLWGFSNENSDWDIRFIYKKRNVKDYITLRPSKNDVIEYMDDNLDIVGWDIKKALYLHYKSNPSLREWLISDQVYIDKGINHIFEGLGDFNISIMQNHYVSIANKLFNTFNLESGIENKLKNYLYIIRSILSWNLLNQKICPPVNIYELVNHEKINIDTTIKDQIIEFTEIYKENSDIDLDLFLSINNFILNSIISMEYVEVENSKDFDKYNERFRELLMIC